MERGDEGMVGMAAAGEPGLQVEVDELGSDAVRELEFPLLGFSDHPCAPTRMHTVNLTRLGQLARPA